MTLPFKDKDKYGEMLKDFETNQKLYGIESLSITNTTLEEVFPNSASCGKIEGNADEVDFSEYSRVSIDEIHQKSINKRLIFFRQFQAIFCKKYIYWKRNLPFFVAMGAIPIIITYLCFIPNNYLADKNHMALKLRMMTSKTRS